MSILEYILSFAVFVVLQACFCNGMIISWKGYTDADGKVHGNILYKLAGYKLEKHKEKWWYEPIIGCIKCYASFYGLLTFIPAIVYLFGWQVWELPLAVFDVFILVFLNYYFYKKA